MPTKIKFIILTLCCISLYLPHVCAQLSMAIVTNKNRLPMQQRIEASLLSKNQNKNLKIARIDSDSLQSNISLLTEHKDAPFNLILALGAQATTAVLQTHVEQPILSALIRKHAFNNITSYIHKNYNSYSPNITALYLDQPFKRQLNLIKIVFANKHEYNVGVILGPNSISNIEMLQN